MIVVDTDVLAYYLIQGERTAQARALRALDPDWRAPGLWRAEFVSVVHKYLKAGLVRAESAHATLRAALEVYGGIDMKVDLNAVLALAASTGASTYDAHFMALAQRCGVPLVTGEKRHPGAAHGLASTLERFLIERRKGAA